MFCLSIVCFSAGISGRENKELLVQHLLVGEDNLKLLLELQQRISGGFSAFQLPFFAQRFVIFKSVAIVSNI